MVDTPQFGSVEPDKTEAVSSVKPNGSEKSVPELFDINKGVTPGQGILLPSFSGMESAAIIDVASYARALESRIPGAETDPIKAALNHLNIDASSKSSYNDISKANSPPSAFVFGRITMAPDTMVNGGIIQWPGISPDALRKIVRENIAPQLIIGMRVDDVLRYSDRSHQIWKPGWRIEKRDATDKVTESLQKEIQEAESFIENSHSDAKRTEINKRDQEGFRGFKGFLAAIVRDSLTFDAMALWKDSDNQDKVRAYAAIPAGNIRLANRGGYNGDPYKFAVAVDEGGRVVQAFSREELTFYVRNPRTDPLVAGYGYPEIDISIRLIAGFQNAFEFNIAQFDRSSTPNGILTISGGTVTPIQLDLLNRLMTNMKKGITKAWSLPVIGLPGEAKLELLDFSNVKDKDAYYKELINMLAGALCMLWRFPVTRFGYRISGGNKDSQPLQDSSVTEVDEDDPGLAPLLTHIEVLINEYLLWTRWPHLIFKFCGKSPKEDARSYEFLANSRTYREMRQESGLKTLIEIAEDIAKEIKGGDEETKKGLTLVAALMELCPHDPNLSGAYQSIAAAFLKSQSDSQRDEEKNESEMHASKDPARSADRGKTPGVRRNSSAESARAGKGG